MNSFPCISHHLFVAAIKDEDGRRTKRAGKNAPVVLMEPVRVIPPERADRHQPSRTVVVETLEPDCLMGL